MGAPYAHTMKMIVMLEFDVSESDLAGEAFAQVRHDLDQLPKAVVGAERSDTIYVAIDERAEEILASFTLL